MGKLTASILLLVVDAERRREGPELVMMESERKPSLGFGESDMRNPGMPSTFAVSVTRSVQRPPWSYSHQAPSTSGWYDTDPVTGSGGAFCPQASIPQKPVPQNTAMNAVKAKDP